MMEATAITEVTPIMTPSIVRKERNLLARRVSSESKILWRSWMLGIRIRSIRSRCSLPPQRFDGIQL